jgi:hypothetical protein
MQLLALAILAALCGIGHSVDHVIRAEHAGWPFIPQVTPFTFSLLEYPLVLVGIYLTLRNERWFALYWLVLATVGLFLISLNHLRPNGPETLMSGYDGYTDKVQGVFFEAMLLGTLVLLAALVATAIHTRRELGHW